MTTRGVNDSIAMVVTTAHRGVFFGYAAEAASDGPVVTLERARMCVYWPDVVHGVLGLAAVGPLRGSRVTSAVPSLLLRDVTAIMVCSEAAAAAWEAEPWS